MPKNEETDVTEFNNPLGEDEEQGNVYPFMEGDDYWTIEDGKVIWSCWDDVSEDIFRGNPYKNYFESEAEANNFLKNIGA
jgi:hypothetical protein